MNTQRERDREPPVSLFRYFPSKRQVKTVHSLPRSTVVNCCFCGVYFCWVVLLFLTFFLFSFRLRLLKIIFVQSPSSALSTLCLIYDPLLAFLARSGMLLIW